MVALSSQSPQPQVPYFAQEIIRQMGGIGKLRAMVGAKSFVYSDQEESVMFGFMTGKSGINKIKITLTPMDLYSVEFWQIPSTRAMLKGVEPALVGGVHDNVYWEDLQDLFEAETGLYLSL